MLTDILQNDSSPLICKRDVVNTSLLLATPLILILLNIFQPSNSSGMPDTSGPSGGARPRILTLWSAIIAQNRRETGQNLEVGTARLAKSTLDNYLGLPETPFNDANSNATFSFWKTYSNTSDKTQKALSKLAREYLTPPTSTGNIRFFALFCYFVLLDGIL